jgi:hypothetical protein
MYMYFNCDNVIFNLQVVVKVLHIPVHVGQGGLVSAVSMLTVLVPLTVMIMVPVMIVLTLQFAGNDSYFTV